MARILNLALLSLIAGANAASVVTWKMKVDNKDRTMLVYAPDGMKNPPLILQLHGMNQDAPYQQGLAKWEPIADTAKFIVAFPNGLNKSWDLSGNTDVNFMSAIIDTMVKKYGADRNRVYISGFSMGGMFTYHAMNKMSDKIAAFAPCSGYPMGGTTPASTRPVPILHIHGTTDDVVGYSGVEGVLSKWRSWNGCPTTKTTIKPYPAGKSGSPSTLDMWSPCTKNGKTVEVGLITNANKGHWYSMDQAGALSSVEIWNFSKKYSLGGPSSVEPRSPLSSTLKASVAQDRLLLTGAGELRSVRVLDPQGRLLASSSFGASADEVSVPLAGAQGLLVIEAVGAHGNTTLRVAVP